MFRVHFKRTVTGYVDVPAESLKELKAKLEEFGVHEFALDGVIETDDTKATKIEKK